MKILIKDNITFSVNKYAWLKKGHPFYVKPCVVLHRASMGYSSYNSDLSHNGNDAYDVQYGLVTKCIQVFWLFWIFSISMPHKTKGYGKSTLYKLKNKRRTDKEVITQIFDAVDMDEKVKKASNKDLGALLYNKVLPECRALSEEEAIVQECIRRTSPTLLNL